MTERHGMSSFPKVDKKNKHDKESKLTGLEEALQTGEYPLYSEVTV